MIEWKQVTTPEWVADLDPFPVKLYVRPEDLEHPNEGKWLASIELPINGRALIPVRAFTGRTWHSCDDAKLAAEQELMNRASALIWATCALFNGIVVDRPER